MTKEAFETASILFEYAAFFLAAPDFLGEEGLKHVEASLKHALSPAVKWFGRIAAWLRRNVIDFAFVDAGPLAFIGFVLFYDLGTWIFYFWLGWTRWIPGAEMGLVFLAILNIIAAVYLVQIAADGALAILKYQHAKGLFFVIGAISFTISKGIAIAVPRNGCRSAM